MSGPARGPAPAIFFLSDYGISDEFVGVVHAVVHRLAPGMTVIDLSHQVAPFDVASAASLLTRSAPFLGVGVVLAVVDPGVGTERRAVAIEVGRGTVEAPGWLVGPDNGLLVPAARTLGGVTRVVGLAASGSTFDGRDVFAPAAAHLALGGDPAALGPDIDAGSLVIATEPGPRAEEPVPSGDSVVVPVSWVDRFGNVQLRLAPRSLAALGLRPGATAHVSAVPDPGASAHGDSHRARWVTAFAELEPGEVGLLADANGAVAVVLDRESAAAHLGVGTSGASIRISIDSGL